MSVPVPNPNLNVQRGSTWTSLFERAVDCLPDGVLMIRDGTTIVYANPAFATIWHVPPGIIGDGNDAALLPWVASQVADPEVFVREVRRLYNSEESSEDIVPLKDGRVFARRSVPFEEDGALRMRLWIFTDVTELHHACIDTVTGLPNRRAYAKDFPKAVEAQDDGLLRSVAIMDLDNFKAYNDTYGHAAGDEVLRRVGGILQAMLVRSEHLVFRIGGEEFLIACRFRKQRDIGAFFEDLRGAIEAAGMEHRNNAPHQVVTSSFGVTVFRGRSDAAAVFDSADAALYRAKRNGKNTVVIQKLAAEPVQRDRTAAA